MKEKTLSSKLRMRPHQQVLILNAPEGYLMTLGELPEGVTVTTAASPPAVAAGTFDFVHLFVRSQAELVRWAPVALGAVVFDGSLWISYPKKSSGIVTDISRDVGWEPLAEAGMRPVFQVSIDDTWSALRYRPGSRVGT